MKLQSFCVVVVVAVFAMVVWSVGCDNSNDSAGGSSKPASGGPVGKITLQLNWKAEPQFGGFFAAQASGAYTNQKLDVVVREGGAGVPTIDMLAAGTVPFAIVSGDEIVVARSRGKPVVALFAVYQTHPQGIMTRASRGFAQIDDVFAQPGILAMEQGLPYSDFLRKKFGFDKLKIVPSPFGDLSVFRSDEKYAMQCFVTSEPLAAKRARLAVKTFLIADAGYNPYATVLATNETFLNEHRDVVKAMVTAVRDGWQSYLADPKAANELMGTINKTMDAQTFAESAEAQKPLIVTKDAETLGLGVMTEERWSTLIGQLKDLDAADAGANVGRCFVSPQELLK